MTPNKIDGKSRSVLLLCEPGSRYMYPHPFDLGELLAERGHKVTYLGPEDADVESWNRGRGVDYVGFRFRGRTSGFFYNLAYLARSIPLLLRNDVVVSCTTVTLPAALLAHLLGKLGIYYAFELRIPAHGSDSRFAIFQYLLRWIRLPVFTTGRARSRLFRKAFRLRQPVQELDLSPLLTSRTTLVPGFRVRDRVEEAWGKKPKLIVCINAGINPLNCFDLILDAEIPASSGIAIAITGPCSAAWRQRIEDVRKRCGNYLYFGEITGTRYNLVHAFEGCDVGLVMKRADKSQSFNDRLYTPNKLQDFLAAGVPVIVSSQITMRSYVREGCAWLIRQPSSEAIADLLRQLLENPDELAQKKKNVAGFFANRGHYAVSADRMVRLIEAKS